MVIPLSMVYSYVPDDCDVLDNCCIRDILQDWDTYNVFDIHNDSDDCDVREDRMSEMSVMLMAVTPLMKAYPCVLDLRWSR